MSRVLITGGAGFIGSHLSAAFLARGDEVVVLDDMSVGRAENVEHLTSNRGFRLVTGSVLDRALVDRLVSSCDSVAHLASTVGVRRVLDQPLGTLHTTIDGTDAVLDAASRARRQKVLIASSSEVYGKNPGVLHEEADRVLGSTSVARWTYGAAKAVSESLGFGYQRERQVPVVVARLFNTVGPGQVSAYGMVLPRFIEQALRGADVEVYGDGEQSRCFCFVADAVRALLGLHDHEGATGRAYNIASPESTTILDLARRVIRITGSPSSIRLVGYRDAYRQGHEEVPHRSPDITRIRDLLGWQPAYSLDETIAETVTAYRRRIGSESLARR